MKMFWKWLWKSLAFLLILAIFVGGGVAIYKAGYANGFTVGALESEGGGEITAPQVLPHHGYPYRSVSRPFLMFPVFGLCFSVFLLLAFFGGIRHLVYYKMWKSAGMPGQEEMGKYWHKAHRSPHWRGPWWESKVTGKDKSAKVKEPDDGVDTGASEDDPEM
jgi:hypothetical protein